MLVVLNLPGRCVEEAENNQILSEAPPSALLTPKLTFSFRPSQVVILISNSAQRLRARLAKGARSPRSPSCSSIMSVQLALSLSFAESLQGLASSNCLDKLLEERFPLSRPDLHGLSRLTFYKPEIGPLL